MNFITPCRVREIMIPSINRSTRQFKPQKKLMAKTQNLILKTHSNKIKQLSEKT